MKLFKFLKAGGHRIKDTSPFLWSCYPDGMYMDINDINGREVASCVFSTKDQTVYEVTATTPNDETGYSVAVRWQDPNFAKAYRNEATLRAVNPDVAWDDVLWEDVHRHTILHVVADMVACKYANWGTPIKPDTKLKVMTPCPFCGGSISDGLADAVTTCTNCGAVGPTHPLWGWNCRV